MLKIQRVIMPKSNMFYQIVQLFVGFAFLSIQYVKIAGAIFRCLNISNYSHHSPEMPGMPLCSTMQLYPTLPYISLMIYFFKSAPTQRVCPKKLGGGGEISKDLS